MNRYLFFFLLLCSPIHIWAQSLSHGPLAGLGTMTHSEAILWARTDSAATVDFEYSTASDLSGSILSSSVVTASGSDFTAKVTITGLAANTTYYYTPRVNTVRALGSPYARFKTAPTPGTVTAFCFFILSDFQSHTFFGNRTPPSFANADAANCDFGFIGGDLWHNNCRTLSGCRTNYRNQYDGTQNQRRTFVTNILRRYATFQYRSDHDCNGSDGDRTSAPVVNGVCQQTFSEYVPHMPLAGAAVSPSGLWYKFRWGHAEFFVLDVSTQRDPTNGGPADDDGTIDANGVTTKSMLDGWSYGVAGNGQWHWLLESLRASTATWKFLMTDLTFNPGAKPKGSWGAYPTEHARLVNFVKQTGLTGVVVISGDMHAGSIDFGTNSGLPEFSVPSVDSGYDGVGVACTTFNPYYPTCEATNNCGGFWDRTWWREPGCWGYGVVRVRTAPSRVVLLGMGERGYVRYSGTLWGARSPIIRE